MRGERFSKKHHFTVSVKLLYSLKDMLEQIERSPTKMLYMVTALRDVYLRESGVEIAGVFDSIDKAISAKVAVEKWMQDNGYEDYDIMVNSVDLNRLEWYEIEKLI